MTKLNLEGYKTSFSDVSLFLSRYFPNSPLKDNFYMLRSRVSHVLYVLGLLSLFENADYLGERQMAVSELKNSLYDLIFALVDYSPLHYQVALRSVSEQILILTYSLITPANKYIDISKMSHRLLWDGIKDSNYFEELYDSTILDKINSVFSSASLKIHRDPSAARDNVDFLKEYLKPVSNKSINLLSKELETVFEAIYRILKLFILPDAENQLNTAAKIRLKQLSDLDETN